MTGRRTGSRIHGRAKLRALPAVAVLCLLLLALLAVIQVAHFHSDPGVADHCPLCITMHSVVPVLAIAAAIVLIQIGLSSPTVETRLVLVLRYSNLFIRPPPSGC